jgi:hypothetical protein
MKRGALRAPMAPPIGRPPIRPPTVLALAAAYPKYIGRVSDYTLDK